MHSREFYDLADVTDAELHANLAQLLIVDYRTEARIVAHLAEVEERRLHLRGGSSSMFDYCVQRLGLSNGEAFQRLTVARLARRFPLIYELIERREVHLTGLCLRDYLTLDNRRELLTEVSRKTKWQIQELLACRFPRADVPATIRKLPASRSTSTQDPALPATTVSTRLPATAVSTRASEATTASPAGARAAVAVASEALCWTGSGQVVAPQVLPPRPLAAETPARARLEPTAAIAIACS